MKLKESWKAVGLEKTQPFDQLKLFPRLAVIRVLRSLFTMVSVTLVSAVGAVQSPSPR
jgi:hypothetical protein